MRRFRTYLLATTFLTTVSFGASAAVLTEGVSPAPADFGNTAGTAFSVPAGDLDVNGKINSFAGDTADFFTFSGLTPGQYSLSESATSSDNSPNVAFEIGIWNGSTLTNIENFGTLGNRNILNQLAQFDVSIPGSLTIGVEGSGTSFVAGFSEGYQVVLAAVQSNTVPEPASLALFSVGLAGAAFARRRRRRA